MTGLLCTLTVLTLIVSAYLSVACFNIIRRMRKETPWSLALFIIAIAALGAYAFLDSIQSIALWIVAQYSILYIHVSPSVAFATLVAAIVMELNPRVDTW